VKRTALLMAMVAASCSGLPPHPASLDTQNETCAFCRMAISDARLASQIVAPGEEPKFFDDIGCLRDYLREHPAASGAVVYVTDHRTKAWVPAVQAVFTRVPGLETPMASYLVAHADPASRDHDPVAKGGENVPLADLFGPGGPAVEGVVDGQGGQREGDQGGDALAGVEAERRVGADLLDGAGQHAAGAGDGVLHLAAGGDDLEHGRPDLVRVAAVGLADLAVGGGVQVQPVHPDPDLIGGDRATGVKLPGRLRQDAGRVQDAVQPER